MIKGVNRTIIEVAHSDNRYFERALLFVRPEWDTNQPDKLQKEATHWLKGIDTPPTYQTLSPKTRKKYRTIKRTILATGWWLLGTLCGLAIGFLF